MRLLVDRLVSCSRSVCSVCRVGTVDDDNGDADDDDRDVAEGPPSAFLFLFLYFSSSFFSLVFTRQPLKEDDFCIPVEHKVRVPSFLSICDPSSASRDPRKAVTSNSDATRGGRERVRSLQLSSQLRLSRLAEDRFYLRSHGLFVYLSRFSSPSPSSYR